MTVLRRKYHNYLGMYLDYRTDGGVCIGMRKYVKDTYKIFLEDLGGHVTSPAADHL